MITAFYFTFHTIERFKFRIVDNVLVRLITAADQTRTRRFTILLIPDFQIQFRYYYI